MTNIPEGSMPRAAIPAFSKDVERAVPDRNRRIDWSEERIALLRRLWSEGMTASDIAMRLGPSISRNAVIGKAHRLGLEARISPIKRREGGPKPRKLSAPPPTAMIPAPTEPIGPQPVARNPFEAVPVTPQPSWAGRHKRGHLRSSDAPPAATLCAEAPALTPLLGADIAVPRLAGGATWPDSRHCCWPLGDPKAADFHFCGAVAMLGRPYCTEHCERAVTHRAVDPMVPHDRTMPGLSIGRMFKDER